MGRRFKGVYWGGPYPFGPSKPLLSPKYCLITDRDITPVYVLATYDYMPKSGVLPPDIIKKCKKLYIWYRNIEDNEYDTDVNEKLDYFREKYGLEIDHVSQ